ncbi:MAG: glutamate 5-kinase [Anaerolineae bacterium]|nr:glutamate 5-kinase [Thermoflexales bacterium]MDW8395646.1 glutamate 5-kinase [Anaerolineae bacterium]
MARGRTQTLVVKVGTSTLTAGTAHLNRRRMLEIARQIVHVREEGARVALVSSGAIAAGRERLGVERRNGKVPLPEKQMLAAVGQTALMALWEQVFGMFDVRVAQVLLTRADLSDRRRYLNARDVLRTILDHHILPIVNENDAVTTEEIRVGDNDNLSALVANVLDADLLLILSDIDGLFTADPRKDKAATLIPEVHQIDEHIYALAGSSASGLGTGGMSTKIQAAALATRSGAAVVIANGARPNVIVDAAHGLPVGTRFLPSEARLESRKRWILSERVSGAFVADEGAVKALRSGKSLLPVGVQAVVGEFERGEFVAVRDASGREIARGIARYSANDARRIIGKRSDQIERTLGYTYAPMLIHADDLALL